MAAVAPSAGSTLRKAGKSTVRKPPRITRRGAPGADAGRETGMSPSEYMRVTALSSQDYLDQLEEVFVPHIAEFMDVSDMTNYKDTGMDIDVPLFQPFPSEVRFQGFQPLTTYELPLSFKNMDSVGRRMKLLPSQSPYFEVIPPAAAGSKVAPGVELTYTIRFRPDELKDYADELVCVTEREKFIVPLRAIGARAVLDIPDTITFPAGIVKNPTTKTLLVRNIGAKEANFTLSTATATATATSSSQPSFSVEPQHGRLQPMEHMQVLVTFRGASVGSFQGSLIATYDSGESTYTSLFGSTEDANIRLEKSSLRLENTFIGMSCQRTIRIHNRSNVRARFQWKMHASAEEEDRARMRATQSLRETESSERDEFSELLGADSTLREQMSLLNRKFQTKQQTLQRDEMSAEDDIFIISPMSSEIWPNSDAEITITFNPRDAESYSKTFFCDITGRETRLPLKLKGDGLGPHARFNFDSLNLGNMYVGSPHTYETILSNLGDIPASFQLLPSSSMYSKYISFQPAQGTVDVQGHQAIKILINSPVLGEINEDFEFRIEGAPEPLKLNFQGRVIGPTFEFDVDEIDFGCIPFGFVSSKFVSLINTSHIPMTFTLHLPHECPVKQEFEISPVSATIPPNGEQRVQIDMTPSSKERCDVHLVVDVKNIGANLLSVPILADCVVPDLQLRTQTIQLGPAFLGHPYPHKVEVYNPSDFPAKYRLQESSAADAPFSFDFSPLQGIIAPKSTTFVPVTITPRRLGELSMVLLLEIVGSPDHPLSVPLSATGQGPVVSLRPEGLDWGSLSVLSPTPKTITLTNESLIPASFSCSFQRNSGVFGVSPTSGDLAPGASADLTVTAVLDDTVKFFDKLVVTIPNSGNQIAPLNASGTGTTIVCNPGIEEIDLRAQFADQECETTFVLTNSGRRLQRLTFALDSPPPNVNGECRVMRNATFKKRRTPACPNPPDPERSLFGFYPETLSLAPGESAPVVLRGFSNKPQRVSETFMCFGSYESEKQLQVFYKSKVTADFIHPLLRANPSSVSFLVSKASSDALAPQSSPIQLTNVSDLPLTCCFKVDGPFILQGPPDMVIKPQQSVRLQVQYNPNHLQNQHSRQDRGQLLIAYKEHANVDSIPLVAEVHFPNISFSRTRVDFGCILNDTDKSQRVTMTNKTPLPVQYQWSLQKQDDAADVLPQVFDILPTNGSLAPNQQQEVVLTFHGHPDSEVRAVALCEVINGPVYEFALEGSASEEQFHFSQTELLFDKVSHKEQTATSVQLINDALVPVEFRLLSGSEKLEVTPTSGTVAGFQEQAITVALHPGVPETFEEKLVFQVGHQPPRSLIVRASSSFPRIVFQLPRLQDAAYKQASAEAATSLGLGGKPSQEAIEKEMDRLAILNFERQAMAGTSSGKPAKCVFAPYALDFGAVLREQSHSRTVALRNDSPFPLSLAFSKPSLSAAADRGLSVSPDKVTGLPPGQSTNITVVLSTRGSLRHPYPLGDIDIPVILDVVDGPRMRLNVQALVSMPSLELSQPLTDFGVVDVGNVRKMHLRVRNTQAVACSWSVQKKSRKTGQAGANNKKQDTQDALARKQAQCFDVSPSSGVLQPGEAIDLALLFSPTDNAEYNVDLPLIIEDNQDAAHILLKGSGRDPELQFSTPSVQLPPVLPHSVSDEVEIVVSNPSDTSVEFFCLEFDESFREEQDVLSAVLRTRTALGTPTSTSGPAAGTSAATATSASRVLLPKRSPGDPLPSELVDSFQERRLNLPASVRVPVLVKPGSASSDAGASAAANVSSSPPSNTIPEEVETESPARGEGSRASATAISTQGGAGQQATASDERGGVGDFIGDPIQAALDRYHGITEKKERLQFDHGGLNMILHGPAKGGKSGVAKAAAAAYHSTVVTIDGIILASIAQGSANGLKAKVACVQRVLETEQLSAAQVQAEGKGPRGTLASIPSSTAPVQLTPESPEVTSVDVSSLVPTELPQDLAQAILQEALTTETALRGVIVDGLGSKFIPKAVDALQLLLKVLARRQHMFVVFLSATEEACVMRLRKLREEAKRKEQEEIAALKKLPHVPEIDEEEYDRLTPEERQAHEAKLLEYKRKVRHLRELEEKAKREAEERLRREAEEQRLDEERSKSKKNKAGRSTKMPEDRRDKSDDSKHARHDLSSAASVQPADSAPAPELEINFPAFVADRDALLGLVQNWNRKHARVTDKYRRHLEALAAEAAPVPPPTAQKNKKPPLQPARPPSQGMGAPSSATATASDDSALRTDGSTGELGYASDGDAMDGVPREREAERDAPEDVGVALIEVETSAKDEPSVHQELLGNQQLPSTASVERALGLVVVDEIPEAVEYTLVRLQTNGGLPEEDENRREVRRQFEFVDKELQRANMEALEAARFAAASAAAVQAQETDPGKGGSKRPPSRKASLLRPKSSQKSKDGARKSASRSASRKADEVVEESSDELDRVRAAEEQIGKDLLKTPRWVVAPKSSLSIWLRFRADRCGVYDQPLTFQTVLSGRQSVIYARGACEYPHLSTQPSDIFSKKQILQDRTDPRAIVQQKFIVASNTIEFGPLLCGMPRDDFREERYKSNVMHMKLQNPCKDPVSISAGFDDDTSFTTFALDPVQAVIEPGETLDFRVWAYPKNQGEYKDRLIICVKDNPTPLVFNVSAEAVQPALDFEDKKGSTVQLLFERVLLHRKATKILVMKNNKRLPVAWSLTGLDQFGAEFSVAATNGIVDPLSSFSLPFYFTSSKPAALKKIARLEISDVENIAGIIQSENIIMTAEAYDVALDVIFPKGKDGILDFETMRVSDDKAVSCTLKNKGKYDINYRIYVDKEVLASQARGLTEDAFDISPSSGVLHPGDKSQQVKISFMAQREVTLVSAPILKCEVVEPFMSETIAHIPIQISVKSVYSKYSVLPLRGINFGAMPLGSAKQTREIIIENTGEYEFKFHIAKQASTAPSSSEALGGAAGNSQVRRNTGLGLAGANVAASRRSSVTPVSSEKHGTAKFAVGPFTISPSGGVIAPGAQMKIIVEADAQSIGKAEHVVNIDVEQRAPNQHPQGFLYSIAMETCTPSISLEPAVLFEEHSVVQRLQDLGEISDPTFSVEDNEFHLGAVVVGKTRQVRVKVSNPSKVATSVTLSKRNEVPEGPRVKGVIQEYFVVEPLKLDIPSHEARYVTVTFTPQSIQTYTADLAVNVDGQPEAAGASLLAFKIRGDAVLPRVTILQPTIKSATGVPLLQFRRTFVDTTNTSIIAVRNDGPVPALVSIEAGASARARQVASNSSKRPQSRRGSEAAGVAPGTSAGVAATPSGTRPVSSRGRRTSEAPKDASSSSSSSSSSSAAAAKASSMKQRKTSLFPQKEEDESGIPSVPSDVLEEERVVERKVSDGPFTCVGGVAPVLLKPGMRHDFAIEFAPKDVDSFKTVVLVTVQDNEFEATPIDVSGEGYMDDVTIEGLKDDALALGSVPIGEARSGVMTLVNHSTETLRFNWKDEVAIQFSPQCGHLRPKASKDIKVTFQTREPVVHESTELRCDVARITYATTSPEGVPYWDSSCSSTRWVVEEDPITGRLSKREVVDVEPEPVHILQEGSQRQVGVTCSAVSDHPSFKCEVSSVPFKETLLHQKRVFTFPFANTGKVRLQYKWTVEDDLLRPEPGYVCPFSIEPASGAIEAGETLVIKAIFAPETVREEFSAVASCQVEGHATGRGALPRMELTGKSLRPFVHFDLEDSDYVSSGRRRPGLPGPSGVVELLSADLRVIEFSSVGVKTATSRKFTLRNPTDGDYQFSWRALRPTASGPPATKGGPIEAGPFKCLLSSGSCVSGKQVELAFEYSPDSLELTESFWEFSVPKHNISTTFLLVGHATEPRVSLSEGVLELKPLLLGQTVTRKVTIVNDEDSAFTFKFDEQQLKAINKAAAVQILPLSGKVEARSSLEVTVKFSPQLEQPYNFKLGCQVRRKPSPLVLNVRGEGYAVHCRTLQTRAGMDDVPINADQVATLDFGDVHVHEKAHRTVQIVNEGKYPLTFSWRFGKEECTAISIDTLQGSVPQGSRVPVEITFSPKESRALENVSLVCAINGGPVYNLNVKGSGVVPLVDFSSKDINFGKVFVHRPGMPENQVNLVITNRDTHQVSVACLFKGNDWLTVQCPSSVLKARGTLEVPIVFRPNAAQAFKETVEFELNSLTRVAIQVRGFGTPVRLVLEKPTQRSVSFGACEVGSSSTRVLNLVNDSALPITMNLVADEQSLVLHALGLNPGSKMTLQPKKVVPITVKFSPKRRIPAFVEEVSVQYLGQLEPLFEIHGACQGVEIEFDHNQIAFGAVAVNSQSTRRFVMTNNGDMGAKFRFDGQKLGNLFSITPSEGYISPGLEVTVSVTFHPTVVKSEIRCEGVACIIEGVSKPIYLDLTGAAVVQTPEREVLHFSTEVRKYDYKSVKISNNTNYMWTLAPVIDHEFFAGPETLSVAAGETATYELTYHPLTMTSVKGDKGVDESKNPVQHTGSIFFPLPDGSAILYQMVGQALPPSAEELVTREVPSKVWFAEQLNVKNWLKRSQRFRVTINKIKGEQTTVLRGADYIDVPGDSSRAYKIEFYAYKEGVTNAEVIFRNEQTGELLRYDLSFKATPAGVIDTIVLKTSVRRAVAHTISFSNPLPTPVSFSMTCTLLVETSGRNTCTEIHGPSQFRVPPRAENFEYAFEFLPLRSRDYGARLVMTSAELGVFQYDLQLSSLAAGPLPTERFKTELGGQVTRSFQFTNFCTTRCEYTVSISEGGETGFVVPATITAPAAVKSGTAVAFDISFEPCVLGDAKATMLISSPVGGDFVCPLYGQCLPPKPSGPHTVKAGANSKLSIPFKNVFSSSESFAYTVDHPAFSVKASETYRPREAKEVVVKFDGSASCNAKLTITGTSGPAVGVEWIFYLKGTL